MKTTKHKRNKKSDDARLAAGAKKIDNAKKEAKAKEKRSKKKTEGPPLASVVIPESTRPIQDILADRVTVLPGSIGLQLADETPIEETLRVFDWTLALSDHAQFMIGDVINFGNTKFGEKYNAALIQTGRSRNSLQHYASVAKRIPPEKRQTALSFDHHRTILTIGDAAKIESVLTEVAKQAEVGNAPTSKELRIKVQKLTPRKKKEPKKATSGKGKKRKAKPEPPPYQPTPDEDAALDIAEDAANTLAKAIREGGVFKIVGKCDNKEHHRWLKIFEPFFVFYNALDRITGY